MALSIAEIKEQITLTLYDYMLTSDEEAYWFSIPAIRDGLDPVASGAMIRMGLKGLIDDGAVERGHDPDAGVDIFSLTEDGILAAEEAISARGIPLREYSPAPSADLIITRLEDQGKIYKIQETIAEIGKELRENNEVGSKLGGDKDIITNEVAAAQVLVAAGDFRLRRLIALILPALRFLGDKFVGTALGEAAKRLIKILFEV